MMVSSSAAASSSTILQILQPYAEQTSKNLRWSIPSKVNHRRQHSSSTVGSAATAAEQFLDVSFDEEEEVKPLITKDINIYELNELANCRIMELRERGSDADYQLVMEIKSISADLEKLKAKTHVKDQTKEAVREYSAFKKRLIDILNKPL